MLMHPLTFPCPALQVPDISVQAAQKNFKKSLEKGVLKILSKMGISLLSCYHGAQIFEAYGLGRDVVDLCFRGTVSRIGGMSLADLQREAESLWVKGFPEKAMTKLEDYGFIQSKPKGERDCRMPLQAATACCYAPLFRCVSIARSTVS